MSHLDARQPDYIPHESRFDIVKSPEKPFEGRSILVTGGSSGTGLAVAEGIYRLGGSVIIGTRTPENFEKARAQIGERTHPLIADFSLPGSGLNAAHQLIDNGVIPTDVVLAAAGGMESYLKPIATDILRLLRASTPEDKSRRVGIIREKIRVGTDTYWNDAKRTNFDEQRQFVEALSLYMKPDSRLIDLSSLWSSVFGQQGVEVPNFYRIIAETKHMMEEWMGNNGKMLADRGIYTGIVSGHLVKDSITGQMLDTFLLPLLSQEDQARFKAGCISKQDMVDPIIDLLKSDPKSWNNYPRKLFVYGPGPQVAEDISVDNPVLKVKFPI